MRLSLTAPPDSSRRDRIPHAGDLRAAVGAAAGRLPKGGPRREQAPLPALRGSARNSTSETWSRGRRRFHAGAAGIRVHPAKACLEQLGCDDVVALQEGISELYELGFDDLAE